MIQVKNLVKKYGEFLVVDDITFSVPQGKIVAFLGAYTCGLAYGVDALRDVLADVAHFGLVTDLLVLSLVTVFFLGLASYLFSKIEL